MKERDEPPPTRHLIGLRETKSNLDVIRVDVTRPRLVNLDRVSGETRPYTRHLRASVGVRVCCSARHMCWQRHQVLGESGAVSVPPALARRGIVTLQ